MASLFVRSRQAPPRVPTDEVLPVHIFDDSPTLRSLALGVTLRFDDILDPDKLHDSLTRLISDHPGWRKLGGRIRLNPLADRLEIHVPKTFTPDRPAVRYSHVDLGDTEIASHPLASRLPRQTDDDEPSLQAGGDDFVSLGTDDGAPRCLEDWVQSDAPQFSLHVVTFADASLVSLSWSHVSCDGMGRHALLKNWTRVLAGRDDEVQPLLGSRDDPLAGALASAKTRAGDRTGNKGSGAATGGRWMMEDHILTGFGRLLFILGFIWELIFGARMKMRTVFLPARAVKALRDEADEDLRLARKQPPPPTASDAVAAAPLPDFLSDGDILTAWMVRMTVSRLGPASKRPVSIINVFSCRDRLPSFLDGTAAYVQNMAFPSYTFMTAREILTSPLGRVAARLRTSILAQVREEQVLGMLRLMHGHIVAGNDLVVAERRSLMVPVSNWAKTKVMDIVDFSPAVVRSASPEDRFTKPGKPVCYHSFGLTSPPFLRHVVNILGKDARGNYWIMGMQSPATWRIIEKELARMRTEM